MHRRLLASVAAAALALGLVSCADEPAPTRPPSINIQMPSDGGGDEAAPSDGGGVNGGGGEADPTTEEHAIPAPDPDDFPGMDEHTPEGAEQAARYFVAQLLWAFQTGETAKFETLYVTSCETCTTNSSEISALRQDGHLWAPTIYTDGDISHELDAENSDLIVAYDVHLEAHSSNHPTDGKTRFYSGTLLRFRIGLIWTEGEWLVSGVGQKSFKDSQ